MIQHTYDKPQYAVRVGRYVNFMKRPEKTRQKKYREPALVKTMRFEKVSDAERAIMQWEQGKLF